jgi:orotidine-5'-phosphate decarboxylase
MQSINFLIGSIWRKDLKKMILIIFLYCTVVVSIVGVCMTNPIICALDTSDLNRAIFIARTLRNKVGMIKLGLEFFAACGLSGVEEVSKCGIPIFLDIKLHDIPNTVAKTIKVIKDLNIRMLTLHIAGGMKMLHDALSAVHNTGIKLIGVTVLTSINNNDLNRCGIEIEVKSQVILLAKLAKISGLHGVVCSALEAQEIRRECGREFNIITPGIRMDSNNNDQRRTATPREAITCGADYIVIGRPITESNDPVKSAELIFDSLL